MTKDPNQDLAGPGLTSILWELYTIPRVKLIADGQIKPKKVLKAPKQPPLHLEATQTTTTFTTAKPLTDLSFTTLDLKQG